MEHNKELPLRTFSVVTTFNKNGLETYGQNMIKSYEKAWPSEVKLYVYAEECKPEIKKKNIILKDLNSECQALVDFKEKWKNDPRANGNILHLERFNNRKDRNKSFKWDAIRFSHKVYSIFHCASICDSDVLIWMDGDMICHHKISVEEIDELIPFNMDICYIGRENKWPECGLYSINLKSKNSLDFLKEFQRVYDDAENGIFLMDEWHDSFVFQEVLNSLELKTLNWAEGLITGEGHPLINSEWGRYLDHLKGNRKTFGKSLSSDLLVERDEKYWRNI